MIVVKEFLVLIMHYYVEFGEFMHTAGFTGIEFERPVKCNRFTHQHQGHCKMT